MDGWWSCSLTQFLFGVFHILVLSYKKWINFYHHSVILCQALEKGLLGIKVILSPLNYFLIYDEDKLYSLAH